MKQRIRKLLFCIFVLACIDEGQEILLERGRASVLGKAVCTTEAFREQRLLPELYQQILKQDPKGSEQMEDLTAVMLNGNFYPERCVFEREPYLRYKYREYTELCDLYRMIWNDIKYFPVAAKKVFFEDSWLERRYGEEWLHEGCDLSGEDNKADFYPIISMTDGTIETVGWTPFDGYRIGVRAPSGGCFYYARLSSYDRSWEEGDFVEAGEILGFMGDSGGVFEGTEGNFSVHLHLGIYIRTPYSDAMSVNPFWVLRAVEKKIKNCVY